MALGNSSSAYGGVARALHWSVALLILTVIPLGLMANTLAHDIESGARTADDATLSRVFLLFSLHKTIGMTIFVLAILRIGWSVSQPKPAPVHPERRVENFIADTVHWVLYGSLVLVPLTGWLSHAAQPGFAPIWGPFPDQLSLVPQNTAVKEMFADLHILFERIMLVAIVLHVAGALRHWIIDKDITVQRMALGISAPSPRKDSMAKHAASAPFALAVLLWASAIGAGAVIGFFQSEADEINAAIPIEGAAAVSDYPIWSVADARLTIAISKSGQSVAGSFENFDTEIRFDPEKQMGAIDVIIDITSFTLGSDTQQALSPAFLDAAGHPGARFFGAIEPTNQDNQYRVDGQLRLKGVAQPLEFVFDLQIDGNQAEAQGQAAIDRRDFGIGNNIESATMLDYNVDVHVAITAHRES